VQPEGHEICFRAMDAPNPAWTARVLDASMLSTFHCGPQLQWNSVVGDNARACGIADVGDGCVVVVVLDGLGNARH
jgi:hypothetical protein